MISLRKLRFHALLYGAALAIATAQTFPSADRINVTANATGVLTAPTNFFTSNNATITSALGLGTAATRNTGTTANTIPLLGTGGTLTTQASTGYGGSFQTSSGIGLRGIGTTYHAQFGSSFPFTYIQTTGNYTVQQGFSSIGTLSIPTLTGTRTWLLQDASGTVAFTSDLAGYQPLSANLTSWAAKTPYAGNFTISANSTVGLAGNGTLTLSGNGTLGSAAYTATSAYLAAVTPGSSGNVLTSNGTAWISSAPSGGGGNITINATSPLTVNGNATATTSNATLAISSATSSNLGVIRLSGSSSSTVSSAGNTTITLSAAQPNLVYTLTASAGAGAYIHNLVLSSTNAHAGAFATVHIDLAASVNPRIGIRSLTSGGTLIAEAIGTGSARRVTVRCVFDGTAWAVVSRVPSDEGFFFTRSSAPGSATATPGPYTWTFPAGARTAYMVGGHGGGGGGSGRRGAAGSDRSGGGGGGGGGGWDITLADGDLGGTSATITVGAGGVGGAAVTADNTNGNAGTAGTISTVVIGSVSYGTGGAAGQPGGGGSTTTGTAGTGTVTTFTEYAAANGAAGSSSTGSSGGFTVTGFSAGGGGGGGINAANTSASGGAGAYLYNQIVTASPGGAAGVAGSSPSLAIFSTLPWGANGAGGGGAGAAGGNGILSSGGGGGGASANGTNSGTGGNGGDGFVYFLISY